MPRREPADGVASHRVSMLALSLPPPEADLLSSYRSCSRRARRHCREPACSSSSSADRMVNRTGHCTAASACGVPELCR